MTNRSEIIRGMAESIGVVAGESLETYATAALDYLEAKVLEEVQEALIAINDLVADDYFEPEKVIRELVKALESAKLQIINLADYHYNGEGGHDAEGYSKIVGFVGNRVLPAISAAETYLKGE